jgi:Ca2+-binding EF-hand superfamily protein
VGLSREQFNEIRAAFNQIDQNKDGILTKRELKNMLRPLHREVGEDEIAKIVEKADVNKDGVISFLEFQNAALAGAFSDVELRKSPSGT